MNNKKIISGYELVAKGSTKVEATLPELGLKNIFPNGSWLENKQIQAAIESRKHLINVERIDKSGVLSHAVWQEEIMMAEVIQKAGSYWQYLGHNVGKKLFLKPEEALFLLEISSLCLKHNDLKVSLQQAYTLLLRDKVTVLQYKVYSSLSRLGYRVYRHDTSESSTCEQSINLVPNKEKVIESADKEDNHESCKDNLRPSETENCSELNQCETINEDLINNTQTIPEENITAIKETENSEKFDSPDKISTSKSRRKEYLSNEFPNCSSQMKHKKNCTLKQLQKLKNRQQKPCNIKCIFKYFDKVPEFLDKNVVTLKTPDKHLLPNTINLSKPFLKVNLQNIQKKIIRPASTETNIYTVNDEVNGNHIRRLRSTSIRTEANYVPPTANTSFSIQNTHFRPFQFWRPRHSFQYCNVNMLFQRPFVPGWFFAPNLNFFPRAQPSLWRPNFYNSNRNISNRNRKKMRKTIQKQHLDGILKLSSRLKQLILNGNMQEQNIYSLQRLIQTYNTKYKAKVRLNERFDIVVDEMIVDTIELDDDDDEGPSTKRRRTTTTDHVFEENLNNLKLFALRLKELEYNDKSSAKHRRAFSKLLKTFNDSYNDDYYLNDDYEIACRNKIDLDTSESSDADCIIEDTPKVSGKKLKNPFNILKRLSEMQKNPTVNDSSSQNPLPTVTHEKYSQITVSNFTKNWLPREDDFGRAEVISKDTSNNDITDIRREEFLYDFLKIQTCKYDNWLDLKNSFFNSIQAAIVEFQETMPARRKIEINSIVKPEDCADMASVLKKLSVIKTERRIANNCNLAIDFDVYNRDVQNFRKTNRPTPHFRIVCFAESANMPLGDEIAGLHSKYADQVTIVFAIVGIDSISYIQINPTDLPVYISNNIQS